MPSSHSTNSYWPDTTTLRGDEPTQESFQLVPIVYNDLSNGLVLPYQPAVHSHVTAPHGSQSSIDATGYTGISIVTPPSHPTVVGQPTPFYGATSFNATGETDTATYAAPLSGYAPCQESRPWDYARCFGTFDEPPCPMSSFVDIEDFM